MPAEYGYHREGAVVWKARTIFTDIESLKSSLLQSVRAMTGNKWAGYRTPMSYPGPRRKGVLLVYTGCLIQILGTFVPRC